MLVRTLLKTFLPEFCKIFSPLSLRVEIKQKFLFIVRFSSDSQDMNQQAVSCSQEKQ